jgi:MFS family permease
LLSGCWALAFSVLTSGAASANLAAASLTDAAALASFPLAVITFISGLFNLVLPQEIGLLGRYRAYLVGAAIGAGGCVMCWAAMLIKSLALLLVGCVLVGIGLSHAQNYRFGVLQCVPEAQHPVAISWVLAGGVAGAILGPEYSKHTRNLIEGVPFGGIFLVSAGCFGLLILLLFISAPALKALMKRPIAKEPTRAAHDETPKDGAKGTTTEAATAPPPRRLAIIYSEPRTVAATLVASLSYAIMVFLMSAVPLAMADGDAPLFSFEQSSTVVQIHMVSMFAPSFFTGHLIKKFGVPAVQVAGALLLTLGAVLSLTIPQSEIANYASGQAMVGLGWNWCFIAATSGLQIDLRRTERTRVQSLNDLAVFSSAGTASLLSGTALRSIGWAGMNVVAIGVAALIAAIAVAAEVVARRRAKRNAAGAAGAETEPAQPV